MNKPGKSVNMMHEQSQDSMAGFDNTGNYLRKLRTEKGLSLKDVCEETRISEVNLRAMEEQDFAALPADTFARGMLTNYARFLGGDPAQVVARFMRERDQQQPGAKRSRNRAANDGPILSPKKLAEPAHISSITMAGILLLVIVVLFTGFCLYTSWNPFAFLFRETESLQSTVMHALPGVEAPSAHQREAGEASVPSSSPLEQTQPRTEPPEQVSPAPVPAPTASSAGATPGPNSVTIEFRKDSRLTFSRDNEPPVSVLYKKGEKLFWPAVTSMQLTFDQADSAVILVNDQLVAFPAAVDGLFTLRFPPEPPPTPTP
ncbi:MAG: helix-turn-helix domain-containing protein [Desulfobulbaceae bacterium]